MHAVNWASSTLGGPGREDYALKAAKAIDAHVAVDLVCNRETVVFVWNARDLKMSVCTCRSYR
jgi:hypothetical protein